MISQSEKALPNLNDRANPLHLEDSTIPPGPEGRDFSRGKLMNLEFVLVPVLKDNYSVIVHDEENHATWVVDPAEAEPIVEVLAQRGWTLTQILNTHHHGDHVGGNLALKTRFGAKIYGAMGEEERIPGLDVDVWDQGDLWLGSARVRVIQVPGHTARHVAFFIEEAGVLFSGDTLFSLGCGRVFGGSVAMLWESLDLLRHLPPGTQVYCAHEYTAANARFALSVDSQNPALVDRVARILELRARDQATVPFSLSEECETNPFLRPECERIRDAIGLGPSASSLEVFARLRALKDVF